MERAEILYVEDNPNDIELTLRTFRKRNLANNIRIIKDGEEAIEYIFATGEYSERNVYDKPRLILLDINLPKISGLEILKALKSDQRTKSIPVVILTSSREESDMIESYEYGVNSYVVKPVNFDNFSKAVSSLGLYWLLLNESL